MPILFLKLFSVQECDMYVIETRDRDGDTLILPPQPWWKPRLIDWRESKEAA